MTDTELIIRYNNGHDQAFAILVDRYRRPLFSYLYRMVGDQEAAKDIFQDVFIKVLKALPDYQDRGKFINWLFSIANAVCIDYLRKKKRRIKMETDTLFTDADADLVKDIPDPAFSPDDILQNKEQQQILRTAIQNLPIEQRQILLLREHSDLSFKEIANMLDCPLNTVLGRMRYALLNLRKIIKSDIGGDVSNVL